MSVYLELRSILDSEQLRSRETAEEYLNRNATRLFAFYAHEVAYHHEVFDYLYLSKDGDLLCPMFDHADGTALWDVLPGSYDQLSWYLSMAGDPGKKYAKLTKENYRQYLEPAEGR